jgi:predicted dehydrogenase
MAQDTVRIGIVGFGRNTRERHYPGFKALKGVDLVSVSNRSRESGDKIAEEFDIPKVYDHWTELVASDDSDAIMIGTWPYMHCQIVLAALAAGKHVLTEARMAMDATQARMMLDASREKPHLVSMVVPSPFTLKYDKTIQEVISQGLLGDILAIDLQGNDATFINRDAPLHWRHNRDLSGYNILNMGIWYEALLRWVGPAVKVQSMVQVNVNRRKDAEGVVRAVTIPDHVEMVCQMACGALAHMRFSSVTGLARAPEAWLFGSEGTLQVDMGAGVIRVGKRGDKELKDYPTSPSKQGKWRVEEEFVNAIRGVEKVTHTTFEDGVKYMEFTEAVTRSAQSGMAVGLRL